VNYYGVPEITVEELARMRAEGEAFVLLDVREAEELRLAAMGDEVTWAPLSELAARGLEALPTEMADKTQQVLVLCHHGNRSAQVAAWLRNQGWHDVWNVVGGIDAYARQVDRGVGLY
jgi:rhodanese-related sulfurtransferase